MKSLIILSLFVVTAYSQTENIDPKSVRVALETSFLFHPEDAPQDIGFVKNLKKFLGKIEKILSPSIKQFRSQHITNNTVINSFLKKLAKNLIKFNDVDLKNVVNVFESQIKVNDFPGSVWHKILTVPRVKGYVRDTIKLWSETDAIMLKEKLRKYIESEQDESLKHLITVLENYYNEKDKKGLKKFTKKLMKRTEDLNMLIKKTLNSYVFEKFESLNDTEKARIAYEVTKISESLSHLNETRKLKRSIDTDIIENTLLDDKFQVNDDKLLIPLKETTTEIFESFLYKYLKSNNIEDSSDSD